MIQKGLKHRPILSPIALLHNLIFIDTGYKGKAGFFEVNLAGGVNQAYGEDFSFEPFACQSIPPAVSIFTTLILDPRLIIPGPPS